MNEERTKLMTDQVWMMASAAGLARYLLNRKVDMSNRHANIEAAVKDKAVALLAVRLLMCVPLDVIMASQALLQKGEAPEGMVKLLEKAIDDAFIDKMVETTRPAKKTLFQRLKGALTSKEVKIQGSEPVDDDETDLFGKVDTSLN